MTDIYKISLVHGTESYDIKRERNNPTVACQQIQKYFCGGKKSCGSVAEVLRNILAHNIIPSLSLSDISCVFTLFQACFTLLVVVVIACVKPWRTPKVSAVGMCVLNKAFSMNISECGGY